MRKIISLEDFLQRWNGQLSPDKRTYGMRFCFSGAEGKGLREGLYRVGARNLVISYYYLRNWLKKQSLEEISDFIGKFDFVILDSGAYTVENLIKKGEHTKINPEEYVQEYYEILPKIHYLFAGCTEMNIQSVFSQEQMEESRNKILDKGIYNIVPVYQGQSIDEIENYNWFRDHPYIGIASKIFEKARYRERLIELFQKGRDQNCVFHAFGVVGATTVLKFPFFSCDSSVWKNGSKFGATMVFLNGRIRHYNSDQKSIRRKYRKRAEDAGINFYDIEMEKSDEIDLFNAVAWVQWADYVRFNSKNCYWLTPEEKDLALDLRSKSFNSEGLMDRISSIKRAEERRIYEADADSDDRVHEAIHCDQCLYMGRCPRYKPKQICGYDINIKLNSKADLNRALKNLLEVEYGRVMNATLFEKLDGGGLDKNVSTEMSNFLEMLHKTKSIFDTREEIHISASAKGSSGSGVVSKMLASVFSTTGSGISETQKIANRKSNELAISELENHNENDDIIDIEEDDVN